MLSPQWVDLPSYYPSFNAVMEDGRDPAIRFSGWRWQPRQRHRADAVSARLLWRSTNPEPAWKFLAEELSASTSHRVSHLVLPVLHLWQRHPKSRGRGRKEAQATRSS